MPVTNFCARPRLLGALTFGAALLAGVALSPTRGEAQSVPQAPSFTSARPVGMGNAFVGGGNSSGALFSNPAGLVTVGVYSLEVGYQRAGVQGDNSIGVSVIDSKTNPAIALGAGYAYTFGEGLSPSDNDNTSQHDISLAAAFPIVQQVLAVGVGGRYLSRFDGFGPPPADAEDEDAKGERLRAAGFTLDAGLVVNAGRMLSIGGAVRNLLVPEGFTIGRSYQAGLGLFVEGVHVEAEWIGETTADGSTFGNGVAAGIEYTLGSVPVRAGWNLAGLTEQHYVSAGIGWRSTEAGVDFGFRQNVSGIAEDRTFIFSLSGFL